MGFPAGGSVTLVIGFSGSVTLVTGFSGSVTHVITVIAVTADMGRRARGQAEARRRGKRAGRRRGDMG
jgi:hypothetical protein